MKIIFRRKQKYRLIKSNKYIVNKTNNINYIMIFYKIIYIFFSIAIINKTLKTNNNLNISLQNSITNKTNEADNRISNERYINTKTNFKYYCCFCTVARRENRYARELISYYMNLGVEKFVFGDNNFPNTEKLSDVLQDYINNGTVDIIEIFGSSVAQGAFFGKMYEQYKEYCEWLAFFDFDEYLVMHFKKEKKIKLKEYLSNQIFDKCEAIEFNWLIYGDNGLVYYDNRPLIERFTEPNYNDPSNKFVKSIVRGNLNKTVFDAGKTHHQPSLELNLCNSLGEPTIDHNDCIIPPLFKYAYLMHFNTKTAEEYVDKIKKGINGNMPLSEEEGIDKFFQYNEFTEEKLKVFEQKLNKTFTKYHTKDFNK